MTGAKKEQLQTAIIEFYREEIRQRYQLERLCKIPEFETIPDTMLDALREFFLERLYPSAKVRIQMDQAFDDLLLLLTSPVRLTPLIGTAITSMLRLSFQLPAILSTGISTVDAIKKTRLLETGLMAAAKTIGPELEALHTGRKSTQKYRRTMLRLISDVPPGTVHSLIDNVLRLFASLSDIKMVSGMLHLVERCLIVMELRRDVYTDRDREGMKLCMEVLRGGHNLFVQLKPEDFPNLLKGIERVEVTWYESVTAPIKRHRMNRSSP